MKSTVAFIFSDDFFPYLFVLPVVLFLLVMTIFPLIYSLYLSFTSWELAMGLPRQFVGFEKYVELFYDARFWNSMLNTGYKVLFGVGAQFLIGLGLALLMNRKFPGKNVILTLFLVPSILAPVVTAVTFQMLYNYQYGPVSWILHSFGLPRIDWLGSTTWSLPSIIIVDTWQWIPFMMMVLLAGLQSIPERYYEAARLDGSPAVYTFFYVTLPLLTKSIAIALIIRIMDAVKLFDLVYVLTSGGPGTSSETVPFYTYLSGFQHFRMGYTAAMSYIQLIFLVIMAQAFLKVWEAGET